MSIKEVWFITGAGRGMGTDFAKAALGPHHLYLLFGGLLGLRVRHRVRGVEVRYRRLDGLVARGTSTLRHHHHDVNPGFFRTELLTEQSTNYAPSTIRDYDERRAAQLEFWKTQNGKQSGDPAKLARALITIAFQQPPPRRFIAGADAIGSAEQKIADLKAQVESNRALSTSLDFD